MHGITPHVSEPKIKIVRINPRYNLPTVYVFTPSLPRIRKSLAHIRLAFQRLITSLLSTVQACKFGVGVYYVTSNHVCRHYIHDIQQVIQMKFNKSFLYVPIWKHAQ